MSDPKRQAYGVRVCECLTSQLMKFRTLNAYQLAGHAANLAFWMAEVRHCLELIDGYPKRFEAMRRAQQAHVKAHHVELFDLDEPYLTERPPPPVEVPKSEMTRARDDLCAAWHAFLIRCVKEQALDPAAARGACESLGVVWNGR